MSGDGLKCGTRYSARAVSEDQEIEFGQRGRRTYSIRVAKVGSHRELQVSQLPAVDFCPGEIGDLSDAPGPSDRQHPNAMTKGVHTNQSASFEVRFSGLDCLEHDLANR